MCVKINYESPQGSQFVAFFYPLCHDVANKLRGASAEGTSWTAPKVRHVEEDKAASTKKWANRQKSTAKPHRSRARIGVISRAHPSRSPSRGSPCYRLSSHLCQQVVGAYGVELGRLTSRVVSCAATLLVGHVGVCNPASAEGEIAVGVEAAGRGEVRVGEPAVAWVAAPASVVGRVEAVAAAQALPTTVTGANTVTSPRSKKRGSGGGGGRGGRKFPFDPLGPLRGLCAPAAANLGPRHSRRRGRRPRRRSFFFRAGLVGALPAGGFGTAAGPLAVQPPRLLQVLLELFSERRAPAAQTVTRIAAEKYHTCVFPRK